MYLTHGKHDKQIHNIYLTKLGLSKPSFKEYTPKWNTNVVWCFSQTQIIALWSIEQFPTNNKDWQ
jgi:hypothetical protein